MCGRRLQPPLVLLMAAWPRTWRRLRSQVAVVPSMAQALGHELQRAAPATGSLLLLRTSVGFGLRRAVGDRMAGGEDRRRVGSRPTRWRRREDGRGGREGRTPFARRSNRGEARSGAEATHSGTRRRKRQRELERRRSARSRARIRSLRPATTRLSSCSGRSELSIPSEHAPPQSTKEATTPLSLH